MTDTATQLPTVYGTDDIALLNERAGYHFFEPGSMRFFRSRIGAFVGQSTDKRVAVFVTSEKGPRDTNARRYSARIFDVERGDVIESVHGFQAFATARTAARNGQRFLDAYNAQEWPNGLMRDQYRAPESFSGWIVRAGFSGKG